MITHQAELTEYKKELMCTRINLFVETLNCSLSAFDNMEENASQSLKEVGGLSSEEKYFKKGTEYLTRGLAEMKKNIIKMGIVSLYEIFEEDFFKVFQVTTWKKDNSEVLTLPTELVSSFNDDSDWEKINVQLRSIAKLSDDCSDNTRSRERYNKVQDDPGLDWLKNIFDEKNFDFAQIKTYANAITHFWGKIYFVVSELKSSNEELSKSERILLFADSLKNDYVSEEEYQSISFNNEK